MDVQRDRGCNACANILEHSSLWIRLDASGEHVVFDSGATGGSTVGYTWFIYSDRTIFRIYRYTTAVHYMTPELPIGSWEHLIISWDGVSDPNVYANGCAASVRE